MGYVVGILLGISLLLAAPVTITLSALRYGKTKRKRWLLVSILGGIPVVIFLIAFLAVFIGMVEKKTAQELSDFTDEFNEPAAMQEVTTYYKTVPMDGDSVFIDIPDYWELMENLNEEAIFQAGSLDQDEYLIVVRYRKENINAALGVLSDILMQDILAKLEDPAMVVVERTMISGMDAYQYEYTGVFEDVGIAYLQTVIECPEYYLHILAWTGKSRREAVFPVLREVIDSVSNQ